MSRRSTKQRRSARRRSERRRMRFRPVHVMPFSTVAQSASSTAAGWYSGFDIITLEGA